MKRRIGMVWLAALVPLMALAEADGTVYQEGVHYDRLPVAIEARDPSKVEVIEVFSYACIHCKNFQPAVDDWHAAVPAEVDFYRMPATFDPTWSRLAQAYYAAEALGVLDQVHGLIFSGIHDRGVNLSDPALLGRLFEQATDVTAEEFNQVFNSFSVRSRVQQADARVRAYRINGTPSLIVDGKYRIDARKAGSNAAMLAIVDQLVNTELERRGIARATPAAADAGTEE